MRQFASNLRQSLAVFTLTATAVFCFAACQGPADGEGEPSEVAQNDEIDGHDVQDDTTSPADAGDPTQNDATAQNDTTQTNDQTPDEPQPDEVDLAADGEALLPIVIGNGADSETEEAAETLADYLEEISGASFAIESGDGTAGIVVGEVDDFDSLAVDDVEFGDGPFELEDYVIRSTEENLFLLGSTPIAVQFAVWDLLYQFGHRQFFPPEKWEVVPEHDELSVAIDVREEPDYYNRQGPRGALRMDQRPWAEEHWENWQLRNRTTPTFTLETGHVYESVIGSNEEFFDSNPEYWGLVDGERTSDAQPNVAHEDVQQLFVDHALDQFDGDPDRQTVAMDPRDGNEWSESDESRAIGPPSDQAVFLANLVTEAVVDEYGDDKYVGMYAYSHHSPPPNLDVHPNVIISLATSFIRGGYTFEEMIDGWSERAELLGIREYYGLWVWENSLPGHHADVANTEYLKQTIPHFHSRGARFMNAESNDTWGGYGLGFYLASRMLWDVSEAERIDELIDDFVHRAFGPAEEPMAQFYELIDGSNTDPYVPERERQINDDFVGRMYRLLDEARQLAENDDEVRARIEDLILYTHYVELFRRFDEIDGPERQEAFDDLVSFAWRIRDTMMAESIELVRDINRDVRRDDNLEWGSGRTPNRPSDNHRIDEDKPFSDDEIDDILQQGIANHDLLDFDVDPWDDSGELEPAGFASDERAEMSTRSSRGTLNAVLSTDDGTLPALTISAGHIYDDRGPLRWTLESENGELVDDGEVPPDEQDYHFELTASEPGIYRLTIENTSQGYTWDYEPRGAKLTVLAGGAYELSRNWKDLLYFYVPEDTDEIFIAGEILEGRHEFIDGDGNPVDPDDIETTQGYTLVPVPEGQDGTVWSLDIVALRPTMRFVNIPGYVAFSPDELLLPEEVVDEL